MNDWFKALWVWSKVLIILVAMTMFASITWRLMCWGWDLFQ